MKRRTVKHRPRQWTLDRLYRECWAAPVVWLGLCGLADAAGTNLITPTRSDIAKVTGMARLKNISAALAALHKAFWLRIEHVGVVENGEWKGKLLKIKLLHRRGENRPIGTNSAKQGKNESPTGRIPPLGITTGQSTPQDSPYGEGRTAPPLSPTGGASGTPALVPPVGTNISAGPTRPIPEILGLIRAK